VAISTPTTTQSGENPQGNYKFALYALTSLFFMWGFITCLNDILIPYLKGAFDLNYTQAMLIQFCFFGAYFIVSLPAGRLVSSIGYQKGIVLGLTIAALGSTLLPCSDSRHLWFVFSSIIYPRVGYYNFTSVS